MEIQMLTSFSVLNPRNSGKTLNLDLTGDISLMPTERLSGKSRIGKAIVTSLNSGSFHQAISSSYKQLNDAEIMSAEGVTVKYSGSLHNVDFEYQITLVSNEYVRTETLTVGGETVFHKGCDSLDSFYLNLPGAETLNRNLGENRKIRLLHYTHNNSIFDVNTVQGQVLSYLYSLVASSVFISPSTVISDGSEINVTKFIGHLIDPKKNSDLTAKKINGTLSQLFSDSLLPNELRFTVAFADDFDGRKVKVTHDNETFVVTSETTGFVTYFILVALITLCNKKYNLIVLDDIRKEYSEYGGCLSAICGSLKDGRKTQLVIA